MASASQAQPTFLDRLADEVLQPILDYAMARDSPFYIDDPHLGVRYNNPRYEDYPDPVILESSTGAKDALSTGIGEFKTGAGSIPLHNRTPQSAHRADWIAMTSTSRRIRALGKLSFFRGKTIAMHGALLARLQRNYSQAISRMCPADQALILSHTRSIVIVDIMESAPSDMVRLPQIIAAFPRLRRCTLLFGLKKDIRYGREDHAEWITAAFVLASPLPRERRELLHALGVPGIISLDETLGPRSKWPQHRRQLEDYFIQC